MKIALFTLGRKSRIKSLVKISKFRTRIVSEVQFTCVVDSVNILQLAPYPKAGRRWGTKLSLVREPTNLRDPLCVTGLDVTIFCLRHEYIHIYIVYMGDRCIAGITP